MKFDFKNKKVTVMGVGLHGGSVAMIKWLLSKGAVVTATDKKTKEDLAGSVKKLEGLKNLKLVLGQHRMEDFERAEMVIKNPMVRWDDKYIKAALAKKVPVEMDSSLFFKLCPSKKIIGITGTKGKTTTSLLIAEILEKAGKKVVKVGIGQEAVMDKLSEIDQDSFVVFELSSWRLSALGKNGVSPHIAVVTNIFPDHLNYYTNMAEYVQDKKNIYLNQKSFDYLVLNWDNEAESTFPVSGKDEMLKSQAVYFSLQKIDQNKAVYIEEDKIKFNFNGQLGDICEIKNIALRGAHNIYNALAASGAAIALKIEPKRICEALEDFKGAPHRLELVRKISEIKFYNDTTATTPEAAIAAVNSFSEPIFLICGGSSKKLDLKRFAKKIAIEVNVKKIFLLRGEGTDQLGKLLKELGAENKVSGVFDNINDAVAQSYSEVMNFQNEKSQAKIVLLSPGCASFGMFQNEFDRGDEFKKAVEKII
jgi:UDP-N-acetylmuramoylalanine--D-glutamate ligase